MEEQKKVEFIESYIKIGNGDYKWNDNHGELIRCKECKHGSIYMTEDVCGKTLIECNHPELGDNIAIHAWDWFCADGERRDEK